MSLIDFVKEKVTWVAQACVIIKVEGKVLYIDPLKTSGNMPKADVICITHSHYDHLSADDCKNVVKNETVFVTPKSCVDKVKENFSNKIIEIKPTCPGIEVAGIMIATIPAYNPSKKFHPKINGWVGFVVTVDGRQIYHAGDTNRIPEMKGIGVDVAMLPLGQTYTMDSVEEAVEAAKDTGCKLAIPIHFGMYEGKAEDAKKFESGCKKVGIEALIMKSSV